MAAGEDLPEGSPSPETSSEDPPAPKKKGGISLRGLTRSASSNMQQALGHLAERRRTCFFKLGPVSFGWEGWKLNVIVVITVTVNDGRDGMG